MTFKGLHSVMDTGLTEKGALSVEVHTTLTDRGKSQAKNNERQFIRSF